MADRLTVSRRAALEGLGIGALGLSAAALLGCSSGKKVTGQIAAQSSGQVTGATAGHGLPKNAPLVQGTPKDGGTYLGGLSAATVQHDPHTTLGSSEWDQISEKGLNCDVDTGALKPAVFTSWEVADPSGLTLVMKVSDKLFMAPENKPPWNGRQFDATDAAWNVERIAGLYSDRLKIPLANFQRASMVDKLVKAEAVDKFTVKITLSKPNSAFFNGLWDTRVMFAPREMDDIGWTDPLKFAGPGAWIMQEFVPNVRTMLTKNPNYTKFKAGEPHFDATKSIYLADATAQQSAFISGQSAAITIPDAASLKTVRQGRPP
jgi:ABC-type transport system substrate-binding protein